MTIWRARRRLFGECSKSILTLIPKYGAKVMRALAEDAGE